MDWPALIARMTVNAANIIGQPLGTLAVGAEADVTVIDPKRRWKVNVNKWQSRSRNCPYDGWRLTGRSVATIVAVQVKYEA